MNCLSQGLAVVLSLVSKPWIQEILRVQPPEPLELQVGNTANNFNRMSSYVYFYRVLCV